jgi:hypothetical protein
MNLRLRWLAFLLLCLPVLANARLRGDWESAGDMPPSYAPAYLYSYDCQAEFSDGKYYELNGQMGKFIGVATFELNNGNLFVNGKDLKWQTVFLSTDHAQTKVQNDLPFSPERVGAGIAFAKGESEVSDKVFVTAQLALRFGKEIVPGRNYEVFTREDSELRVRADISSFDPSGENPSGQSRTLYVSCDKKK